MPRVFKALTLLVVVPFALAACERQQEADDTATTQETTPPPAQTAPMTVTSQFTPVSESGVTGDLEVTAKGELTDVKVTLRGAPNGASLPGHIHQGTCEAPGEIVLPLNPITTDAAGAGMATTTVSLPIANVANGSQVVAYHEPGVETNPKTVTCAPIPAHTM